jgi:hypothetical protein
MPSSEWFAPHRAQPPRPPEPTPQDKRKEAARRQALDARLGLEQRSLLRGFILLAVIVVLASLVRSDFSRLLVPGWWRQW